MRTTMGDWQLLQAYAKNRSEEAFAELVKLHLDWVFSVALRHVGDRQQAEDVVQSVFVLLARKARDLGPGTSMGGWLFRTTRLVAGHARRAELRRKSREETACTMSPDTTSPGTDEILWQQLAPHLDQAVAALSDADRSVILLRFYERMPLGKVGERMGVSEEAARKRVNRALEKLREFLDRRGVKLGGVALATILAEKTVHTASAALADAVVKISLAAASASASVMLPELARETLNAWRWAKLKLVAGLATGSLALIATLVLLKMLAFGHAPGQAPQLAAAQAGSPSPAPVAETYPARKATASSSTAAEPAGKVFWLNIRSAADNQSVANAGVILDCWGQGGVVHEANFRSDTNGLCEMPVPAVEFNTFRVWVSAEGFVPKVMDWKPYELEDPATSYTTRLDRGLKIAGVVRDEQGAPVAGAKIAFTGPGIDSTKRENVALYSSASVVRSDDSGQFLSHQMPSYAEHGIGVAASHPDFAAQWLHAVLPESLRTNWVIVLDRGLPVPGRVVSAQGGPVSGATVLAREPHGGADVSATSDVEGNFTLVHMPSGPWPLEVTAAGFQQLKRNVLVESNAAPVLLELQPALATESPQIQRKPNRFYVTVVDADSGAAISRFKVLLDERRGGARDLLGEGHDGAFDWENSLTFAREYAIEVDADGYEPQASSVRQSADGDQTFEFSLRQGG
ncbi:MAG: sigma-70 family RNA polymerase sigma factor, partial [Verrucomicrobia bacterium]|nr:sigma-70 family RNA polymerase sigma factor [Verrucomicrobiota bacterium]